VLGFKELQLLFFNVLLKKDIVINVCKKLVRTDKGDEAFKIALSKGLLGKEGCLTKNEDTTAMMSNFK
tara:strand:- start:171 stop:374 length:204 start_codon:yes stop_codon:yes gene_type:complete